MRIFVYEVRADEQAALKSLSEELMVELELSDAVPSMDNAALTTGYEGVSILGQGRIDAALLDAWYANRVRYLSTRTIGYNHIDMEHAKQLGMQVCNATYAPNGVADFTVMLMLMSLRNYKQALWRGQVNDFALNGLQGQEMKDLTVGIVGTGRIGQQVMKNLSGFGCKMICYDGYQNETAKALGKYVDLDTLWQESDVITLHTPLLDSTYHIVNRESIAKMKGGVVIVNCARGELMDIDALVEGIENDKIGALAADTLEGEEGIIHSDHRIDILKNRNWFYLHQFRNVIMTQHMAFYTDAAVKNMVRCGIEGICQMKKGMKCAIQLV